MSLKCLNLIKGSCVPNMDIVVCKSMSSNNLISLLAKQYVTYLWVSLMLGNHLSFVNIPESYFFIYSASSSSQNVWIICWPSQSFNCCLVSLLYDWNICLGWVDKELVVISSRWKILSIGRPFQSTNLLAMMIVNLLSVLGAS